MNLSSTFYKVSIVNIITFNHKNSHTLTTFKKASSQNLMLTHNLLNFLNGIKPPYIFGTVHYPF